MFTKKFWRDAAERSVATFAESFGGYAIASGATDVVHLNWQGAASTAAFATVLALAKALVAGKTVGSPSSASLDPSV